jgi:hypothetical protein
VSEFDDPGLDELQRQLDAAFASTRPRRGFEDELWRRLDARRPWWRRVRLPAAPRALPALGGLVGVVLVGFLVVTLVSSGALRGHGSGATSSAAQPAGRATEALPFGPLPRPLAISASMAPSGAAGQAAQVPTRVPDSAGLPSVPPRLPVYRYPASTGPPNGAVLEQASLPAGLETAYYPARQPAEAVNEVRVAGPSGRSQQPEVTVTRARIVYVAVTDGSVGYLEPAYELSGNGTIGDTTTPFSVRVSALAASALR